ncbi:MAG: MarR family winged helix-turn-helix transcriptional regulator [Acidimicrobiales bacterium]
MDEPSWLDPDESRAWRGWLVMSEMLRTAIARDMMAESGLSEADYHVLAHLSEAAGHRLRMHDLASRLDWSRSRLSHQVARMEARRLVCREGCPTDARGALAVLSAAGLAEIERAAPHHVGSVRRHLIDLLDRDQVLELAAIAEKVVSRLREQGQPAECEGATPVCGGPAAARAGDDLAFPV